MSNLEDEIATNLSVEMSRYVDFEVLSGLLVEECDWHRVDLPRLIDNKHAVDITYWLEENAKQHYIRNGRCFIFESEKDSVWFALRWS
jgi:hypothetical protein